MKIKKILALVLALVMLLSVMAGCNNEKPVDGTKPVETKPQQQPQQPDQTKPTQEVDTSITFPLAETLKISVGYTLGNATYGVTDHVVWKKMQELANIEFDTIELSPADHNDKKSLMLNGGDYPDIFYKFGGANLNEYGEQGLLIPLEDLILKYAPNLTAILNERQAWDEITAPDGHVYAIPQFNRLMPQHGSGTAYWINQEWLTTLGLEEPKSMEELYNVLKAFKEKDPNGNGLADEIPMGGYAKDNNWLLGILMGLTGAGLSYDTYWMVMDGEMVYTPTTEWFKENFVEFFHKLYAEGLINQDLFTIDRDQFRASWAGEDVRYGIVPDSSTIYFTDPEEPLNWNLMEPFDKSMFTVSKGLGYGGLAITDKCECPEVIMAWIDYFYTEEGGKLIRCGVEGESYFVAEDGTWSYNYDTMENPIYQGTLLGTCSVPARIPDYYYDMSNDPVTSHNQRQWVEICEGGTIVPKISRTTEEDEEFQLYWTDLDAYVNTYLAEAITGIVDIDATWDEFQATIVEMGCETCQEIQDAAYQRALANQQG